VRDDGPGFDPDAVAGGAGLVGLADRVGAAGGELTVASTPGAGTVPGPDAAAAAQGGRRRATAPRVRQVVHPGRADRPPAQQHPGL
jgi:signal transduction histidine kinase